MLVYAWFYVWCCNYFIGLAILSDSTANGLNFYPSVYLSFAGTSYYVQFIKNIWKVISLKQSQSISTVF